jgi:hypothetical protein
MSMNMEHENGAVFVITGRNVQLGEGDFSGERGCWLFPERECSQFFSGVRAFKRHSFRAVCHFPHILPTWLLVFITVKYPNGGNYIVLIF